MPRARDINLPLPGRPGPHNAITDIPGLELGYSTLLDAARACCTGVTALHPHGKKRALEPVNAGLFALNGNGEMTGSHWIQDAGYFASPICLTNTHAVGMAHHATCTWLVKHYPELQKRDRWLMPVVAETFDGVLNDINAFHIEEQHVHAALDTAETSAFSEGNAGGGTGMICYGFKGGTGTSSRLIRLPGKQYTLGVLVQANHGRRTDFTVLGVPVGRQLSKQPPTKEQGSIIIIIATDAPCLPNQLQRIAKRAAMGIARGGSFGGHSSGDIFLAFSTADKNTPTVTDDYLDFFYQATCEAIEEAVLNAMLMAEPVRRLDSDTVVEKLEPETLLNIMAKYNRL